MSLPDELNSALVTFEAEAASTPQNLPAHFKDLRSRFKSRRLDLLTFLTPTAYANVAVAHATYSAAAPSTRRLAASRWQLDTAALLRHFGPEALLSTKFLFALDALQSHSDQPWPEVLDAMQRCSDRRVKGASRRVRPCKPQDVAAAAELLRVHLPAANPKPRAKRKRQPAVDDDDAPVPPRTRSPSPAFSTSSLSSSEGSHSHSPLPAAKRPRLAPEREIEVSRRVPSDEALSDNDYSDGLLGAPADLLSDDDDDDPFKDEGPVIAPTSLEHVTVRRLKPGSPRERRRLSLIPEDGSESPDGPTQAVPAALFDGSESLALEASRELSFDADQPPVAHHSIDGSPGIPSPAESVQETPQLPTPKNHLQPATVSNQSVRANHLDKTKPAQPREAPALHGPQDSFQAGASPMAAAYSLSTSVNGSGLDGATPPASPDDELPRPVRTSGFTGVSSVDTFSLPGCPQPRNDVQSPPAGCEHDVSHSLAQLQPGSRLGDECFHQILRRIRPPNVRVIEIGYPKRSAAEESDIDVWNRWAQSHHYRLRGETEVLVTLFIPHTQHWMLLQLSTRTSHVVFYDSLEAAAPIHFPYNDVARAVAKALGWNWEAEYWSWSNYEKMPQQRGTVDCGVYVIAACVSVITGRQISPSICVPYWRQLLRACLGESFELQLGLPDAQFHGSVDVTTRHRNAHGALQTASDSFDAADDMFQAVSALYASSSAEVEACAATSTADLEMEIMQREHILELHKAVVQSSFHEEDTSSQATLERALDARRKRLQELTQQKDHAQFQHSSVKAMWRTMSDLRSQLKSAVERREAETVAISRELLALEEYVKAARLQGIPGL